MFNRRYSIKPGYRIRKENAPYIDEQPTGIVYQPDIYEFAIFLAQNGGFKYLVDIGAGNGEKLKNVSKDINVIAIDYAPNLKALKKSLPNAQIIDFNLENGLPELSDEILSEAVVISADVIEHIVNPHNYLKGLSKISKIAPYVLVSTPDRTRARGPENFGPPDNPFHVREWSIDELYLLFKNYQMPTRIGHSISNDSDRFKGTILAVTGTQSVPNPPAPLDKVLTIITVYNEEDIIAHSIQHLLNQGSDIHIIENWSTDESFKIVKKMAKKHKNITFERFPKNQQKDHPYEWLKILKRVEEVAATADYDWILHNDADELRLSPWKNATIQQALTFVGSLGYNAIDLTVIDFRPTKDGYDGTLAPDDFFHNFEFTKLTGYLVQVKGWKNVGEIELAKSGGHQAEFNDRRIFPLKFITKHYPLRSKAQAHRKIFKDREGRLVPSEKKLGMHIQYNNYDKSHEFIWSEDRLKKFTPDYFYTEYMVELLSGIGLNQDEE